MAQTDLQFTWDASSLEHFYSMCSELPQAVVSLSKRDMVDVSQSILNLSNSMVPIDTGTLAESAGYEVTTADNGDVQAIIGYGVVTDKVNPRTGQKASEYALTVHESYHYTPFAGYAATGQSKFLEKAFNLMAVELPEKIKANLRRLTRGKISVGSLARQVTVPIKGTANISQGRYNAGFTARHGGEYLPYPPYTGAAKGSTKKTASSVRSKVHSRYTASTEASVSRKRNRSKFTWVKTKG